MKKNRTMVQTEGTSAEQVQANTKQRTMSVDERLRELDRISETLTERKVVSEEERLQRLNEISEMLTEQGATSAEERLRELDKILDMLDVGRIEGKALEQKFLSQVKRINELLRVSAIGVRQAQIMGDIATVGKVGAIMERLRVQQLPVVTKSLEVAREALREAARQRAVAEAEVKVLRAGLDT